MPTVSVISPPYWKGYILVECVGGKVYKYVRNVLKTMPLAVYIPIGGLADSSGKVYYTWGDSLGDSFIKTGDTYGRILCDYNRLCTILAVQKATSGKYMLWPEAKTGGDTALLIRPNREQLFPVNISADTYSYRMHSVLARNVNTLTRIQADQIQSISLIQERITDWYKTSYSTGNV